MAVEHGTLRNKNTGNALSPRVSYTDVYDVPEFFMADSFYDSGWVKGDLALGQNVVNGSQLAYRVIKIGTLQLLYFSGQVTVKKSIINWGENDPNQRFFYFPKNIVDGMDGIQYFNATIGGTKGPVMTLRIWNNHVDFVNLEQGRTINDFGDQFDLTISGKAVVANA